MSKKPNFFIVGAPKTGTTSMYHYLRSHPDVFMPHNDDNFWLWKEPNFFSTDLELPGHIRISNEQTYHRLFEGAKGESRIGESTSFYIYSYTAPQLIKEYAPDARIIMMLRHPVDMLLSWHHDNVRWGHDNILSFEEAFRADEDRRAGRRLPPAGAYPKLIIYRDMVSYARYVKRYLDVFDADQIRIYLMDDLKADAKAVYLDAAEFLGLNTSFIPELRVHNPSVTLSKLHGYHMTALHYYYQVAYRVRVLPKNAPAPINRAYHWFLRQFGTLEKSTVSEEFHAELMAYFQADIDETATLIGRDLSMWK